MHRIKLQRKRKEKVEKGNEKRIEKKRKENKREKERNLKRRKINNKKEENKKKKKGRGKNKTKKNIMHRYEKILYPERVFRNDTQVSTRNEARHWREGQKILNHREGLIFRDNSVNIEFHKGLVASPFLWPKLHYWKRILRLIFGTPLRSECV